MYSCWASFSLGAKSNACITGQKDEEYRDNPDWVSTGQRSKPERAPNDQAGTIWSTK